MADLIYRILLVIGGVILGWLTWSYEREVRRLRAENDRLRRDLRPACQRCGERDTLMVHHRNRDPWDQRPENLTICCGACLKTLNQPRPSSHD